jgi:hypothetical protein
MYWEPGYNWQEELFETFWCMECASGKVCQENDVVYISDCDTANTYFEYVGGGTKRQFRDVNSPKNLCLSLVPDGSAFANGNPPIRMKPCGNGNGLWETKGYGSFASGAYEMHPAGQKSWCITTQHHPKEGEEVRIERCGLARKDLSELWYRY